MGTFCCNEISIFLISPPVSPLIIKHHIPLEKLSKYLPTYTNTIISLKVDTNVIDVDVHRTRAKLEALEDFSILRASDLKMRIEELLRIKGSVSMELRDLEAKRGKLQQELVALSHKIDQLKSDTVHQQMELDRVKISVQQVNR